jgi:tRNA(Ile)-lysidine synthase
MTKQFHFYYNLFQLCWTSSKPFSSRMWAAGRPKRAGSRLRRAGQPVSAGSLWRLGYTVIVAHLDHGLRPESAQEAAAVQRAAARRGLLCIVERADTPAYAAAQGLSLEEAARHLRYGFLFAQAGIHAAQAVASGHNADDQVETVLMHLLRGAGLSGLRGMRYRSLPNAWVIRSPGAPCWEAGAAVYATPPNTLQPSQDASNQDARFFRNRLAAGTHPLPGKL